MYCVKVGYFCPLKSGLSRHTLLYIQKNINTVMLYYLTSEKADTMCELIYCVKFGYFLPLKSGLIRHTVLAISQRLIQFCCII